MPTVPCRCPGCRRLIPATQFACAPCYLKLPEGIRTRVEATTKVFAGRGPELRALQSSLELAIAMNAAGVLEPVLAKLEEKRAKWKAEAKERAAKIVAAGEGRSDASSTPPAPAAGSPAGGGDPGDPRES